MEEEIQAAFAYAKHAEQATPPASGFLMEARKSTRAKDPNCSREQIEAAAHKLRDREVAKRVSDWGRQRAMSHGWFDNYTFSKALGEMALEQDRPGHVQLQIVRPSGITAAVVQPCAGWLDAFLLVEPLIQGVGTGLITGFPGDPEVSIDVIPVDMVTSVVLAAVVGPITASGVQVFQAGTGFRNPITLGRIEKIWRDYFLRHPMKPKSGSPVVVKPIKFYSTPQEFEASNRRFYLKPIQLVQWLVEATPFWGTFRLTRSLWVRLDRLARQLGKALRLADLYCAYTMNSWRFETTRTERLMATLAPQDKRSFEFDPGAIDWERFWCEVHIPFMRRYLLKEEGHLKPKL
eukprot:TRINITY_DN24306_c0_g1_i3.p1 TRINITY_DN24306_c0_g1~~TRINITY_DN24306_c0_g1_i3.p1  ORF type:complete len:348 (-),score=67.72 TRINITY_DN24306_c0_g1_i3:423-1466(-)